jgi:hypothetical protein
VHEEGFGIARGPDGELRFSRPDGRALAIVPARPPAPADPVGDLVAEQRAAGLTLHARTACPIWYGERVDVAYALDVLRPPGPLR